MTQDLGVVAYVMTHPEEFDKTDSDHAMFSALFGPNSLSACGMQAHRRIRKVIAPAFGSNVLKSQMPSFIEKANGLRDAIIQLALEHRKGCRKSSGWLYNYPIL